jgi:glutathione S-transferase
MFELYDFTFSHYSEKARWALDFKGVPYTPRHLLPGFHMRTARKLAPRSSIPILKTDSAVIQGSTEIIDFLEQTFPDRSLTPRDAAALVLLPHASGPRARLEISVRGCDLAPAFAVRVSVRASSAQDDPIHEYQRREREQR